MPKVAFCAVMHQPWRIRRYRFIDVGRHLDYFDEKLNRRIFERVARKSYIPALKIMKDLAEDTPFKINLSFTGTFLDQAEKYEPVVIKLLQELYHTGKMEIIAETYYHSLAFLISEREFREEVKLHLRRIRELFGTRPKIFRNTEAMYSNEVARSVEKMGFRGIVTEGSEKFLGWRSPNWPYRADGTNLHLFLRNYRLSDDIAFRFSARSWEEWPLTADKYAIWLSAVNEPHVVIYIDFETFGEHHWPESGIFDFLSHLPYEVAKWKNVRWANLRELLKEKPVDSLDIPFFVSWADMDRDLSAWLGNRMQKAAFEAVKSLEPIVRRVNFEEVWETWRRLITSDHFYYMSTKFAGDEEVHSYFRGEVYSNPYEAFANYMNILQDFMLFLREQFS